MNNHHIRRRLSNFVAAWTVIVRLADTHLQLRLNNTHCDSSPARVVVIWPFSLYLQYSMTCGLQTLFIPFVGNNF
jgi:hypothetical protein